MKKKIIFIIFLVVFICMAIYMVVKNSTIAENKNELSEYTPEGEISDEDLRNTIITLYFVDEETGKITSEARLIDSKELLREPYDTLIGMLIEGPKDSNLITVIPENAKLLNTSLNSECLTLDFSEDFINSAPEDDIQKSNMIYMIVNTLTELKEVSSVKFLINGEEVEGFEKSRNKFKK